MNTASNDCTKKERKIDATKGRITQSTPHVP